ncbi:glycosyltransferase family 4 protein [Comamonadaceae bacterium G21597-S1]|nr:glycosyltransferase family 4 protein [Comamonadaceae bacterium G21597-S1]
MEKNDASLTKVAFVLPWSPANQGGVTGVVQRLMEHWASEFKQTPILLVNDWNARHVQVETDATYARFDVLGRFSFMGLAKGLFLALPAVFRLARFLRFNGIGVINFHYPGNAPLIIALMKSFRLYSGKLVLSYHGTDVRDSMSGLEYMARAYILRSADAIVACSKGLAGRISETFEIPLERVTVIYNGVDGGIFHPLAPPVDQLEGKLPHSFIVSVGSYISRKGHDITLKAFALIAEQFPDLCICFAGADGPSRTELVDRASVLGISSRVYFFVDLPPRAVAYLVSKASLLVQASHAESFPLSLLEAAAVGVSIVASDISGHDEIIVDGHSGTLFEAGNVDACARSMVARLLSPEVAGAMSAKLRDEVLCQLTWTHCARHYQTVFEG